MIGLTVAPDREAAAQLAAERVATAIERARAARGVAHVALAGGTTPRGAYELLAGLIDDWTSVHLWFGDERCVPADDDDSNYAMVAQALLGSAAIAPAQVHRIAGEHDPAAAAADYERELRELVATGPTGIPALDLALLGLGEDGHTASLFPDSEALAIADRLCVPVIGPKPPPQRITLTLPALRAARQIVVLAAGAGKAAAVEAVLAGPSAHVPASLLTDPGAELIVDRAAAPPDRG
jgi:6-phosphogluconolactonase